MKQQTYLLIGFVLLLFAGCSKEYEAPIPYQFSDAPGAGQFVASIRRSMDGIYTISNGATQFGNQAALKWTYVVNGADTSYYLSIFTGTDAGYFNLEADSQADSLVLKGYWRELVDADIGLAKLTLRTKRRGTLQLYNGDLIPGDTLVLDGAYGDTEGESNQRLTFTYTRPLNPKPFAILAHRSGGRTSDLLPASENSVEIIKLASRLGATGIEIDVRFTKDGVPILYHDNFLNLRLIQKNGLTGPVEEYTYQQLSSLVRLINGEKIPTLEEALETVLNNTPLDFVWLDTKFGNSMERVQAIQQTYLQKAKQMGRTLNIVIGLPTDDAVSQYRALPVKNTPVLCELDTALTRELKADFWAPRWTLGPQTAEVEAMKANGLTVYVWTLDEPQFIREFINQNQFDGILSNYSSVVAYYHYTER